MACSFLMLLSWGTSSHVRRAGTRTSNGTTWSQVKKKHAMPQINHAMVLTKPNQGAATRASNRTAHTYMHARALALSYLSLLPPSLPFSLPPSLPFSLPPSLILRAEAPIAEQAKSRLISELKHAIVLSKAGTKHSCHWASSSGCR